MTESKILTREELFQSRIKIEKFEIEALGGSIYIKELSGKDIEAIQSKTEAEAGSELVARSICDVEGKRMIKNDVERDSFLSKINVQAFKEIAEVCSSVNNVEVSVEDTAKN